MVRWCDGTCATVRRATVQACPAEAAKERRPVGHSVGCATDAVQPAVPRANISPRLHTRFRGTALALDKGMSWFAFVLVLAVCTVLSVAASRLRANSPIFESPRSKS